MDSIYLAEFGDWVSFSFGKDVHFLKVANLPFIATLAPVFNCLWIFSVYFPF